MQWTGQHTPLITGHGRVVTMARSTGRTSKPDKPVTKTNAFEHQDEHHQEDFIWPHLFWPGHPITKWHLFWFGTNPN